MSSDATRHINEPKRRAPRGVSRSVFALSLLLALAGGVLVGMYRHHIYAAVAPVFGIKASADALDVSLLQQAYRELKANYDGDLDDAALAEGATRGLIEAAGDDYTAFLNTKEVAEFKDSMSGSIGGGVGAQLGIRDERVTLVRILANTPAERAGLMAGDQVVAINDESTEGFTVEQAVGKIRGEVGTTIKLRIQHDGVENDVTITRESITAPSVETEIKEGVGVIMVSRFDNNTAALVRQAAERMKGEGVKGFVLDLRGNPGGYLSVARDMAAVWLPKGSTVVLEKEGNRTVSTEKTRHDPVLEGVSTIVLVDGSSASASEIVAGALQDHGVATVVGETTFGKGSVQRLVPLAGGTMLKVTVSRWYTPKDRNITKEGIAPDTEVTITPEQLRQGNDVQLQEAIRLVLLEGV